MRNKEMFHFSHTMEAQLGGITKAGFVITGFYEDRRSEEDGNPIRHFMPSVFVARAQKMIFPGRATWFFQSVQLTKHKTLATNLL